MKLLILSILAALACVASARIGETPEQLVKRYGPSTPGERKEELRFHKNGIYVTAILWKGRCHGISFSHKAPYVSADSDEKTGMDSAPLTEIQIQQLMAVNSRSKWARSKVYPDRKMWITEDQENAATEDEDGLYINTREYMQYLSDQDEAEAAKKTKGF